MVIDQMVAEDLVAAARGLREADLQRFRDELEQQRQFRLDQLVELTDDARVAGDDARKDIVEIWGEDSFPASDPPANW
ncbi:hypothetical protein GCM10009630_17970 [Kribbella jejuensis]|uniref:Uncharacterized protein n=1 Tax=Kribbella jejuensis TaxID=236068 RepID=A0A542ELN1_9ACTN|nr:hypothetical protein [Kribbella jejuensis]TQJ16235.1 hypothetical protein FB475_0324 [Kribbella jejuensis]